METRRKQAVILTGYAIGFFNPVIPTQNCNPIVPRGFLGIPPPKHTVNLKSPRDFSCVNGSTIQLVLRELLSSINPKLKICRELFLGLSFLNFFIHNISSKDNRETTAFKLILIFLTVTRITFAKIRCQRILLSGSLLGHFSITS